jgi:hypothetical protein
MVKENETWITNDAGKHLVLRGLVMVFLRVVRVMGGPVRYRYTPLYHIIVHPVGGHETNFIFQY